METNVTLPWETNRRTGITACRLTPDQLRAARVLGGPRERGGIVRVDLDGEEFWGALGGQVVNLTGLHLAVEVYPTYEDAQRAEARDRISDPRHSPDAAEIDQLLAGRSQP